jgi:hypothetical protein
LSAPIETENESFWVTANVDPAIYCSFLGKSIHSKSGSQNEGDSIRARLESSSKVILENEQRESKQQSPRNSTARGITMNWNREHANACDAMRVSFDSRSKWIADHKQHHSKCKLPIVSTLRWTSICRNSAW